MMDLFPRDCLGSKKTLIIAKFCTDQVICSHSREAKPPSYSKINMAYNIKNSKMHYEAPHLDLDQFQIQIQLHVF